MVYYRMSLIPNKYKLTSLPLSILRESVLFKNNYSRKRCTAIELQPSNTHTAVYITRK